MTRTLVGALVAAVLALGATTAVATPAHAMKDTGWGGCCNRVAHR